MNIDPRLIAALIGAGGASAGWVFKAWPDKTPVRGEATIAAIETRLGSETRLGRRL
ncbi:MAG: hypothetical protein GYB24_00280 [Rhodobacteraceae bacterium]|nr:hypothetical protein [Paracoccaceae bacterium]